MFNTAHTVNSVVFIIILKYKINLYLELRIFMCIFLQHNIHLNCPVISEVFTYKQRTCTN